MTQNEKRSARTTRRQFLKTGAAATALVGPVSFFNINHAWSKDVYWDGQPFDAGGATLRINEWGGFWQEFMEEAVLNEFEKTYNTMWPTTVRSPGSRNTSPEEPSGQHFTWATGISTKSSSLAALATSS